MKTRLLTMHGASVEAVDCNGKGAVAYAKENDHNECVKALLGACPLCPDDDQKPNKLITINGDIDKVTRSTDLIVQF